MSKASRPMILLLFSVLFIHVYMFSYQKAQLENVNTEGFAILNKVNQYRCGDGLGIKQIQEIGKLGDPSKLGLSCNLLDNHETSRNCIV